jgi:hypothetical protein
MLNLLMLFLWFLFSRGLILVFAFVLTCTNCQSLVLTQKENQSHRCTTPSHLVGVTTEEQWWWWQRSQSSWLWTGAMVTKLTVVTVVTLDTFLIVLFWGWTGTYIPTEGVTPSEAGHYSRVSHKEPIFLFLTVLFWVDRDVHSSWRSNNCAQSRLGIWQPTATTTASWTCFHQWCAFSKC